MSLLRLEFQVWLSSSFFQCGIGRYILRFLGERWNILTESASVHSIRIFCARLKIDQVAEMEEFCMITLREVESKTNMAAIKIHSARASLMCAGVHLDFWDSIGRL